MLPISKLSLTHQDLEAIEYELGILSHIIQQAGSKLQEILVDLESGGMIQFWVDVAPVVPKIKKTEMFFSIICKAFTVPEMIIRCMGVNKEILRILLDVLKHNEYDIVSHCLCRISSKNGPKSYVFFLRVQSIST